jgi:hypothetical protein
MEVTDILTGRNTPLAGVAKDEARSRLHTVTAEFGEQWLKADGGTQPLPPAGKGLGESQLQGVRSVALRLNTPHAVKTLQSCVIVSDRLYGRRDPGNVG